MKKQIISIGLLVIASFAVYFNSLNAPFVLDDNHKILNNPDIRELSSLPKKLIYPYRANENFERNDPSRPVTYLTYALNYHFNKLNPFGYHLVNVLLHALNAILVFLLATKIFFIVYKKESLFPPLFTALLFAVHPINTSVVSYVYSRSDLLATAFYISAILLFLTGLDPSPYPFPQGERIPALRSLGEVGKVRRLPIYIISLVCFVFSVFSKQLAVTLPAVIFIFDFVLLSNFKIKEVARRKYYHLPFWGILAGYILFRYMYFGGLGDLEAETTWDRLSYIIIQPYIILRYLHLLIIPAGLCIDHFINVRKILDPSILGSSAALMLIVIAIYKLYLKKNEASKIVIFSVFWMILTLSPTSSFFPTSSALVENRLYLSGLGFYLSAGLLYYIILNKSKTVILFSLILILLFGIVTIQRNKLYRNPLNLYLDVIKKYPANYRAHNNLGVLYHDMHDYDKAIQEYQTALQISPAHLDSINNLALAYRAQHKFDKAIEEYDKIVGLNPNSSDGYYKLGITYSEQKDYDKAISSYRKALEFDPNHIESHNNLGVIYKIQNKLGLAEDEFNKVVSINPNHIGAKYNLRNLNGKNYSFEELKKALESGQETAQLHYNLGNIYFNKKDFTAAEKEFNKALEIESDFFEAHNSLGVLYSTLREYYLAETQFLKSLAINPDYLEAHNNLGILWATQKEYDKAIKEFEKTLQLNPDYAKVYFNLGILYTDTKKYDKAVEQFKNYLNFNQNDVLALDNMAKAYYLKADYTNALATTEKLLKLRPNDKNIIDKINLIKSGIH